MAEVPVRPARAPARRTAKTVSDCPTASRRGPAARCKHAIHGGEHDGRRLGSSESNAPAAASFHRTRLCPSRRSDPGGEIRQGGGGGGGRGAANAAHRALGRIAPNAWRQNALEARRARSGWAEPCTSKSSRTVGPTAPRPFTASRSASARKTRKACRYAHVQRQGRGRNSTGLIAL